MSVLVAGPPRSGVSSLAAALAARLTVAVHDGETDGGPPDVVVIVVSAAAPVTPSDCARAARLAAHTAAVVGVVGKIDDHRSWRAVRQRNAALFAAHTPRLADVPWVGCAAAPRVGEPEVAEVVERVRELLADPGLAARNLQRRRETRDLDRIRDAAARVAELTARRGQLLTARGDSGRGELRRVRLDLTRSARQRSVTLRSDLQATAADARRVDVAAFCEDARARCAAELAAFENEVTARTGEVGAATDPGAGGGPELPSPPRRPAEARLMVVLGGGFGLGVASVVTRLAGMLTPGLSAAAVVLGAVAGVLVTGWLVRMRRQLHDRAALDRWATEAAAALRAALDDVLATRLLALADAVEDRAARGARALAGVERDLRLAGAEHARVTAAAATAERPGDTAASGPNGPQRHYPSVEAPVERF